MPGDNAPGQLSESVENQNRQRWIIALLLGVGVLVNYFDRVNLSVSHDALFAEFPRLYRAQKPLFRALNRGRA